MQITAPTLAAPRSPLAGHHPMPSTSPLTPTPSAPDPAPLPGRVELFRLFLQEQRRPEPFYSQLARRCVAELPFDLAGAHVLDLGAGPGYYSEVLAASGARVVGVDLRLENARRERAVHATAVVGDATCLPVPANTFEGVFCSNLLEHVPDPERVLDEIHRVLRPGGWAWVSWTNWYSPWGGHEIAPFHLLGPDLGSRLHARVSSRVVKNPVRDGLWPTSIGHTLRSVRARHGLDLVEAYPRYYPNQRWILAVPGLRELATWNCVLHLRKTADAGR